MEWVETTGKTIEAAKESALDQLGVAEDDAEFEILAEPKAGLFGFLRGEARVRARVMPTRPRPKVERRDRRRRRGGQAQAGGARDRTPDRARVADDAGEGRDEQPAARASRSGDRRRSRRRGG
ncbi:MAG: Jag N-terminal domain-containing protein, partial [Acidimicrobiales bacterium]